MRVRKRAIFVGGRFYDHGMCLICDRNPGDIIEEPGAVAQLVEHLTGSQGVGDSSSPSSTFAQLIDVIGFTFGGLVGAEGSFLIKTRRNSLLPDGSPRPRFVFELTMAERDLPLLRALRSFLGSGAIYLVPPEVEHHLPKGILSITSYKVHLRSTIPFADRYLLDSAKRKQYELWKDAIHSYAPFRRQQGPSTCSMDGCERPVRGRGLCRSHYYQATGY